MAIVLKPHEIRVLGVLIEKSLAQPAYYPMTLNSIVAASNQKSNRDPVLELTEGEIGAALYGLQRWQLVTDAATEPGARSKRFQHEVEKRFGWNAAERAVMAELMIRGPQTIGELKGRAGRMTRIESLDYVREILDELAQSDPPMAREMSRRSGQSVTRYCQLLGGDAGEEASSAGDNESAEQDDFESGPLQHLHGAPPDTPLAALSKRIDRLEDEVAALRRIIRASPADPPGP